MKMGFDPKKQAIQELLAHLNKSDDDELGNAMKPKGLEVMKVETKGDPMGMNDAGGTGDSDDSDPMSMGSAGDGGPKLTDDEIAELIEALQSKLG